MARGQHDEPGREHQLAEAVDQVPTGPQVRRAGGVLEPEDGILAVQDPVGHEVEDVEILAEPVDHPGEGRQPGHRLGRDPAQGVGRSPQLTFDIHPVHPVFDQVGGIGDDHQGPQRLLGAERDVTRVGAAQEPREEDSLACRHRRAGEGVEQQLPFEGVQLRRRGADEQANSQHRVIPIGVVA